MGVVDHSLKQSCNSVEFCDRLVLLEKLKASQKMHCEKTQVKKTHFFGPIVRSYFAIQSTLRIYFSGLCLWGQNISTGACANIEWQQCRKGIIIIILYINLSHIYTLQRFGRSNTFQKCKKCNKIRCRQSIFIRKFYFFVHW